MGAKCNTILKKEKELETLLVENIEYISECCGWGKIKRCERQYFIPLKKGRMIADVMLWHKDGSGTCIELKSLRRGRNTDLNAIGQLLFYGGVMETKLKYMPRLVFAAPIIKVEFLSVLKRFDIPINLLQLTDDRCVYLNHGTE